MIQRPVIYWLQGVPLESHPSKLVGSRGSKNRYFDFDKLAGVCFSLSINYLAFRIIMFSKELLLI